MTFVRLKRKKIQCTSEEVVVGVGVSQHLSRIIHFGKSGLEYSAGLWGKFVIRISTVSFDFYFKNTQKKNQYGNSNSAPVCLPSDNSQCTMEAFELSVQASQALLFSEGIPRNVSLMLSFLPL